jgi:agmatine deiminase
MAKTASKPAARATLTVPGEWGPQKAIWTAWPAHQDHWGGDLDAPRQDVTGLVRTLAAHNNRVRVLVDGAEAEVSARAAIGDVAELIEEKYNDIWLRDIGPIFAQTSEGALALRFRTNSWGGKYHMPEDDVVGDHVARYAGVPTEAFDFVLEGGAIEQDGEGTILATRQTLLNPNRNGWTEAQAEHALAEAFGTKKIIWIGEGLLNDHTDGHIDNIARYVGPAHVVCQAPAGDNDPNAETLNDIARALEAATDAHGRRLKVARIPGAGLYHNRLGEVSPASHMNFCIGNNVVVVPVYGTKTQDAALAALQAVFPDRKVVGVSSRGLLGFGDHGGGSFHCITQHEPA